MIFDVLLILAVFLNTTHNNSAQPKNSSTDFDVSLTNGINHIKQASAVS